MTTINRTYATVELADGTVHERVRILLQDQLAYSKTKRVNKWPDDPAQGSAFLAWHALCRNGLYSEPWETFSAGGAVDLDVTHDKDEAGADAEDPISA